MRFASLGSGSRGNATLVDSGNSCVMIDCGFSIKETEQRLQRLEKQPDDIDAILVTHEHSDHMGGVARFANRHRIPVYMTHGTAAANDKLDSALLNIICSQQALTIEDFCIKPVAVPHDAREPVQFVFEAGGKSLGLLTDLGSITPFVTESYQQLDALMLECNHDQQMLANGPYPPVLKQRVGGSWGHLNNDQAAGLVAEIRWQQLQHLVICHVSDKNNDKALALSRVADVFKNEAGLSCADQAEGFPWLTID